MFKSKCKYQIKKWFTRLSTGFSVLRSSYSMHKRLFLTVSLVLVSIFALASPILYTRGGTPERAYAAVPATLNFQARLLQSNGVIVPDGYYNVQFKLYDASSGGSNVWTETWYDSNGAGAGNDNRVQVRSGYLSVYLGDQTAFGAIDWTQAYWLTMNIGGTAQTATPAWDGEMNPRLRLTSVPYAQASADSDKLDGIDSTGFAQLTPAAVQSLNSANAGLRLNQTGAGDLLQLQGDGSNVLTLSKTGALTVQGGATFNGGLIVTNGQQLTNAGSTLLTAVAITDKPTGGVIGTAAATVDTASTFNVNQTTSGQTLTLPSPTSTTAGRIVFVANVGTTDFAMHGVTITSSKAQSYIWNGSAWVGTNIDGAGAGATSVGTLDGTTKHANGGVISANQLFLQTADATYPGLVSTGSQTFAGAKTYNGQIIAGAGIDLGTQTIQGTTAVLNFTNFDVDSSGNVANAGTLDVAGHAAFGAAASVDSARLLNIRETITITSGAPIGTYSRIDLSPTANSSASGYGAYLANVLATANNFTGVNYGSYSIASMQGTGTATELQGGSSGVSLTTAGNITSAFGQVSFVINTGTGTITNAQGITAQIQNTSTGAITTAYGMRVLTPVNSGGGSMTNNYGIYIDDHAGIGSSNNYNFYSAGTGLNYFGGYIVSNSLGAADTATYVCRNASNQLATCNTTGTGAAFVQGGNSFAAAAVLGTNDSNDLQLETNNTTRLTINATTGNVTLTGDLAVNGGDITSSGNLTITPSSQVNIVGNLDVSANFAAGSSASVVNGWTASIANSYNGSCAISCRNIYSNLVLDNPSVGGAGYGIYSGIGTSAASFTQGSLYNIYIESNAAGAGSTITNNYGLFVDAQTAGTNDYGVAIAAADTQTLWLSSNANNTTAAAGIAFGSSRDTNLYRSAADTLRTDDAFTAAGLLTGQLGATISGATINLNASSDFATNINTGTSTGAISIGNNTGNPAITLDSGTGTIAIGTGAQARTVNIATGGAAQTVTLGSTNGASSLTLNAGTGTIGIGTSASARTVNIATGGAAQTVTLGSTNGASSLTLQSGTGSLLLQTQGTGTLGIGTNAAAQNITIGNTTGATTITLQSGTGGIVIPSSLSGTVDTSTYLCRNSSNQLTTCATTGTGAAFVQGGNSFGATATLGTNDSNSLVLRTNGQTAATIASGGATTFQNNTNSTSAFVVNNSTGGQLLGIDTTNSNVTLAGNNTGELQSWQTNSNNVTAARTGSGGVVYYNGYAYLVGGFTSSSSASTVVEYAQVNADGSLGTFITTTALPAGRSSVQTVIINGYIYVIGGWNSGAQTSVYYARINSDGTIGSWSTTTVLPAARYAGGAIINNGYIYYAGGYNSSDVQQTTVYSAVINTDGTLGSWSTSANSLPAARADVGSVKANGYWYIVGGSSASTVYYAKINANGTINAWSTNASSLAANRQAPGVGVLNGYLYVAGGSDTTSSTTVYYGALNANGSVSAFTAASNTLPAARWYQGTFVANGYLYAVAGSTSNAPASTVNTVYYASGQRVRMGGSLDLIGLSGEYLSEGGSAGSITAGNATFVGSLRVQDGAEIIGNLSVSNVLTAARIQAVSVSTNTTADTLQGGYIAVTDTGIVTSGTDTTYGQQIAVTRTGATGGTINTFGLDIQATGDTGGTSTLTGLNVNVSGADTNYAALFNGGNVGIGTSTPGTLLHVRGTSSGAIVSTLENTQNSGSAYAMYSMKSNAKDYRFGIGNSTETLFGVANKFFIYDADVAAVRMTIDSSGNLGIGDSSPLALLTVGSGDLFQVSSAGALTFNGVATDITTGTNEDLTIVANGTGQIILNDTVQVATLGTASNDTVVCRNGSNQLASCNSTFTTAPASGSYIKQVPTSTAENTITPTANSVVGLTVNGTSGTAATALSVIQGGNATALNIASSGTGNLAVLDTTNASANGVSIDVQSNSSSQYALNVTSNNGATTGLYVRADGRVGLGTNDVSNAALLNIIGSPGGSFSSMIYTSATTTSTSSQTNTYTGLSVAPSGASVTNYVASQSLVVSTNSNTSGATLRALYGEARAGNGGTVGRGVGGYFITSVFNTGSGATLSNAVAIQAANAANVGAGTITNAAGVNIEAQTSATNNTNLLIGTTTIPNGNFSIYNSSTANNLFGGQLSFSGVATDITTGTNEDLTIVANGTGQVILNDTVQVATLGAASNDTVVCRNGSNQLATCNSTFTTVPASGSYIKQVPTSTAENTITPTANSVVGLTINGTSGTAATALNILQGGNATGLNVATTGTGNLAVLDTTNASANGVSIDVQSNSSSQYALQVTSNNGATTGLYVRADGNVGIGTNAPSAKLHVTGGTDAGLGGGGFGIYGLLTGQNIAIDDNEIMARNNGAVDELYLNYDGGDVSVNGGSTTNGLVIGASNVIDSTTLLYGIRNHATGSVFQVNNNSAAAGAYAKLVVGNAGTIQDTGGIGVLGSGWVTDGVYVADSLFINSKANISGGISVTTEANAPIVFATNGQANERLRITGSGDVGIGTSSVGAKLDVAGTTRIAVSSTDAFKVNNSTGAAAQRTDTTNPNVTNGITNGSFEVNTTGWNARSGCTLTRVTSTSYVGEAAGQCVNTGTNGAGVNYPIVLSASTTYNMSVYIKGTVNGTFRMGYAADGSTETGGLTQQFTYINSTYTRYTISFTTPGTVNGAAYFFIKQEDTTARTMHIDGLLVEATANTVARAYREGQIFIDASIGSTFNIQQTAAEASGILNVIDSTGSTLLTANASQYKLGVAAGTSGPFSTFQVGVATTPDYSAYSFFGGATGTGKTLVVQQLSGQTGNLLEVQNSSGGSLLEVQTDGDVAIGTSKLFFDATNSRLGIGTNAPSADLTFGTGAGRTINVLTQTTNTAGNNLTISAGAAGAGASAFSGGSLQLQGGAAAGTGNANGGNVVITGGAGVGTGVRGLVVVDTATFSAATVQNFTGSGNITQSNIDTYGTILISSNAAGYTATLSDPTNTTTGRIIYVTNTGSFDMVMSVNGGGQGNTVTLKPSTTATMVWNGVDWTAAGASSSTDLQAAYNNTATSAGGAELILNAPGGAADGLTIRNNPTTPITGGILEVQSSIGTNLFSVNNLGTELAANGGAETSSSFNTDWTVVGAASRSRTTTAGQFVTGLAGVSVTTTAAANDGVRNNLSGNPAVSTTYTVSFAAKLSSGTFSTLQVLYSRNGGTNTQACSNYSSQTLSTSVWTKITCTITTDATTATDPDLIIRQSDATARTFYIDNLSFVRNDNTTQPSNVQIGGGINGGQITLFTLDRASAPPVANGDTTYLGSMYYDTTTGRIQCYESDGWGACGSAPDNIIVLTPEYAGAVLNGTGVGTMTADFCANQSSISFQVNSSFCTSGLSRQYYRWTSPQATMQTYSIYVSYKLPNTFKQFNDDNTITLTAYKDHATNGDVTYEVFRSTGSAITRCNNGTNETQVTTSTSTWQTVGINGNETSCGFVGGDNIIFKINVKAMSNANVYVENLNFTYTNQ